MCVLLPYYRHEGQRITCKSCLSLLIKGKLRDQTQVARLGGECLHPLSHLVGPPNSEFSSYSPRKWEKAQSPRESNCLPSFLSKVHNQVTCEEINGRLSLEMCFFMVINEDGLDVKGLGKHSF